MLTPDPQLEFDAVVAEASLTPIPAGCSRKDRARALAKIRRAEKKRKLEERSKLTESLAQLGISYFYHQDYKAAIPVLLRAIEYDTSQGLLRDLVVSAYIKLEDYEAAKDLLIDALRDNPKDVWAYLGMAQVYTKATRDYNSAERLLKQALDFEPGNIQARNNLGSVYLTTERFPEAITCMDQVLSILPSCPNAHFGKTIALLAKGDKKSAHLALAEFESNLNRSDLEAVGLFHDAKAAVNEDG